LDTSVILWARAIVIPSSSSTPADLSVPICVSYKISSSQDLSNPADSGEAFSSYDVDYTVKVEATNLKPDTVYYYQFADCINPNTVSPTGKTRTIASPDSTLLR
jgi:alkaline phosphatase D